MADRGVIAKSQRQLAKGVGKDPAAINRWIRDERWPFSRRGPWDVAKVKAWAANTLAPDPAADSEGRGEGKGEGPGEMSMGRRADVALKVTRTQILKLDLDKKRGELHRVDECLARHVRRVEEAKKRFLELADGLPFEPDVKELVRNRILAVLRDLATVHRTGA